MKSVRKLGSRRMLGQALAMLSLGSEYVNEKKLRWLRFPAPKDVVNKQVAYAVIYETGSLSSRLRHGDDSRVVDRIEIPAIVKAFQVCARIHGRPEKRGRGNAKG